MVAALRIVDVSLAATGNAPTVTGTVSPSGLVQGGETVTMTITTTGNVTGTTWTVVTGGVTLAGSGSSRTFTAPYVPDSEAVVVQVDVTGPDGSASATLGATVEAQVDWWYDGTAWQPILDRTIL